MLGVVLLAPTTDIPLEDHDASVPQACGGWRRLPFAHFFSQPFQRAAAIRPRQLHQVEKRHLWLQARARAGVYRKELCGSVRNDGADLPPCLLVLGMMLEGQPPSGSAAVLFI